MVGHRKIKKAKTSHADGTLVNVAATGFSHQPQESKFMQLPPEIREEVYDHFFSSTRISFLEPSMFRVNGRRQISASQSNCLALLRTCRRVNVEIGSTWLGKVLFHFDDPYSLLYKLGTVSISLRSQIRHIRTSSDSLRLSYPGDADDVYYRTAHVLKLLPGLELDTLTVLGCTMPSVCYQTLNQLIRYSDGWKELRFLSHNSKMLGYKDDMFYFGPSDPMNNCYLRQPQPSAWQKALEDRDGQQSCSSVVIYRSTGTTTPRGILLSSERKVFTQDLPADQDAETYGTVEDETLTRNGERAKEVVVVVKRGTGVDYAAKADSPYMPIGDIRQDDPGERWKEKVAEHIASRNRRVDDDIMYFGNAQDVVSKYSHVDEYVWPISHLDDNRKSHNVEIDLGEGWVIR